MTLMTTTRPMGLEVQRAMCGTCIYRPDSSLDLAALEAACADPKMPGYFVAYRACHHAANRRAVCCHGFWMRHKDSFTAGQLAQRLGLVCFVDVDSFADEKPAKPKKARRR